MIGNWQIGDNIYQPTSQDIIEKVTVAAGIGVVTKGLITLPGVAPFLLTALGKATVDAAGADVNYRFATRIGTSDNNQWFSSGGAGGSTDRIIDTLYFGNAQFPREFVQPIVFGQSGNIRYEIENLQANAFFLHMVFYGAWLRGK